MLRNILIVIALVLLVGVSRGFTADSGQKVEIVTDLSQIAQQAKQGNLPVMIFFSRADCDYCKMLEADHLGAMAHSANYKDKVIIRKVVLDDYNSIRDFSGKKIDVDDLSRRFSVSVTPTLVFLDHNGKPLVKKMPGYNRSDFYGYYLDEAIDNARVALQKQAAL